MSSSAPTPASRPQVHRRHPRQRLRGLETPFGVILDVSASGACVFCKGPAKVELGDEITLQISCNGLELDLPARVVRLQTLGYRRLEVGVEFVSLSDQQRLGVENLASTQGIDFSPSVWLAA